MLLILFCNNPITNENICRAKTDRKRYDEQMAKYQPPDKQSNRKRNKTGYNMFFSHHVNDLKQSDTGVPSERGSVARLVGNAWKVRVNYVQYLTSFDLIHAVSQFNLNHDSLFSPFE